MGLLVWAERAGEGLDAIEADPPEFGGVDVDLLGATVAPGLCGFGGDEGWVGRLNVVAAGLGLLVEVELACPFHGVAGGHAVGSGGFEGGGEVVGVGDGGEVGRRGERDGAVVDGFLEGGGEAEQRGAAVNPFHGVAEGACDGFGVEAVLFGEVDDGSGFLDGGEVLAEDVFVQAGGEVGAGVFRGDDGVDGQPAEGAGREVAPVARDDGVVAVGGADPDGLDEAAPAHGVGEVAEFVRVDLVTKLEVWGFNLI